MTIRVLLADDQALLRATFRLLLDAEPDIEVVAEASNGDEAVTRALRTRPDVVVMDIRMPGSDGIDATRRIAATPSLTGTRILILTTFETDEHVLAALRAGASGFLGKGVEPGDLLQAIRVVAAGEALLSPAATTSVIERSSRSPIPSSPPPTTGSANSPPANRRSPHWPARDCRTRKSDGDCPSAPPPPRPTSTGP